MGFKVEDSSSQHSSMEKHIASLRRSVQQTKCAIAGKLKKSEHRFKEEKNNCVEDMKKASLLKKLETISKELQILDDLPEDEIVKFALTTHHNMMAVACNRRLPKKQRMKARVASHKPLSVHLARIKSKLREKKESDDEEETQSSSKSLNKMSVNNQIVKMRKVVKQSKVHIIHKLTRNIKTLRQAKGKNKEKCEKKADRLVKKLKCIKELHEDDISRIALTSTEDLAKLSTNINAPLKRQVMASIAIHKFVADSVAQFKNKYPDLHKNILTVLKKKKKKRKLVTEGTESEQLGKLQNKQFKSNRMDSDDEKLVSENEEGSEEESGEGGSEVGSGKEGGEVKSGEEDSEVESGEEGSNDGEIEGNKNEKEEIEEESENSVREHYNKNNSILHKEESDTSEKCPEDDGNEMYDYESNKLTSLETESKNSNKKLIHKKDPKVSKKMIKKISGKESGKSVNPSSKEKKLKITKSVKSITPKVVDPFFVTPTNEDYVTSQVPSVDESDDTSWKVRNNNFETRGPNNTLKNNRNFASKKVVKEQSTFGMQHYKKPSFSLPNESSKFNKYSFTNITGNRKERRKALHQPIKEEKPEKLHPSWEAKKKLSAIAHFQGKKITFD